MGVVTGPRVVVEDVEMGLYDSKTTSFLVLRENMVDSEAMSLVGVTLETE